MILEVESIIRMAALTLDDLVAQRAESDAAAQTGTAAIYYRIGTKPPVQVLTQCFQSSAEPKSLILWLYDPSPPVEFLIVLVVRNIYIGPGEYKGNVNDILVGAGIVSGEGAAPVWTAGDKTATDLTTYVAAQDALLGTFSVQGLVPGPVLGPPDNPPPVDQPALDILFAYFRMEGIA